MKIKVIKISDDIRSKKLVGEIFELSSISECNMVTTKCGRFFYEGEYEIVGDKDETNG